MDVQVPDYLDWNYHEIYDIIRNEMGWEALPDRDEHVDCLADPAVHYLREIRCGDLTQNTLRYSAEIRSGQRERSEALDLIKEEMIQGVNVDYINYFLSKLEITPYDLSCFMKNPLRHLEYQREDWSMRVFKKISNSITKNVFN